MFLIIVPAYNEENTIGNLLKQIDNKYDVVVVDDGSADSTSDLSKKLGAKVIKSEKNNGVDYSINLGFEYAVKNNYKYVDNGNTITLPKIKYTNFKDIN